MRIQTTFEKISQGMNQKLFAAFFVTLRIVFGIVCLYFAAHFLQIAPSEITSEPGSPFYYHQLADQQVLANFMAPLAAIIGLVFFLGLCVRPVSVFCIVVLLYFAVRSGSMNPERTFLFTMIAVLGFALFAAGGSSHALGLDGIISRNIRRPNVVTKFLFG